MKPPANKLLAIAALYGLSVVGGLAVGWAAVARALERARRNLGESDD